MVTTTIIIITFVAGDEQYSNEARPLLVYVCVQYTYMYMYANVCNNGYDIVPRKYKTYCYNKRCVLQYKLNILCVVTLVIVRANVKIIIVV